MYYNEFIDDNLGNRCIKLVFCNGIEIVAKERSCTGNLGTTNIFVDSSVGCKQKCAHCWLTRKNKEFNKPSNTDFVSAFGVMLEKLVEHKWMRLSNKIAIKFMGQGDALDFPSDTWRRLSMMYDLAKKKNMCVSNISYSTIMPETTDIEEAKELLIQSSILAKTKLYVSVGSFDENKRKKIMASVIELREAVDALNLPEVDLRLHWTPIKNFNDVEKELDLAKEFFNKYPAKYIRIIPYNSFENNDTITACNNLDYVVEELRKIGFACDMLKSAGVSINAACGMFSTRNNK